MIRNLKGQRYVILVFAVFIVIVNGSILQSKSIPQDNDNYPFQLYMVASPESAHQNDQFNMSLAITNIHFKEISNVSVQFKIHNDLEVVSSVPSFDLENDSSEVRYTIGSLDVYETYLFRVEYNVTSSDTKTISVEGMNVSYLLQNGLSSFIISNTVDILLKGAQVVSETNTLSTIPSNLTPPDDSLIYFAYLLPIVMFGISIVILRRLRR
ncbi:MAG: hypothetical protein ACW98F_05165 [Candidatus Hodarchaeales archaeon]|jgi:hypothetical protein